MAVESRMWRAVVAWGIAALSAVGCAPADRPSAADRSAIGGQAASRPTDPALVRAAGWGAIDYFNTACVRCHGPYASFHGPEYARKLSATELAKVVYEMAEGPAAAPVQQWQLAALVDYHRSLVDQRPFLMVTGVDQQGASTSMRGEVTPASVVKVSDGAGEVEATVAEHKWSATISAGAARVIITARRGDRVTELRLAPGR